MQKVRITSKDKQISNQDMWIVDQVQKEKNDDDTNESFTTIEIQVDSEPNTGSTSTQGSILSLNLKDTT